MPAFKKEETTIKSRFATKEELEEFSDILKQHKCETFSIWRVVTTSGKQISEGACIFKRNVKANKIRAVLKLKRKGDTILDHGDEADFDEDSYEQFHKMIDLAASIEK